MHFGTDGIRGRAEIFTDDYLDKVAQAIVFTYGKISVLTARDTRISGERIELALAKALSVYGVAVTSIGIAPTPTLAYLTKAYSFDLGIMISASHNPPEYNGIKLFNNNGGKLSTLQEETLDKLIDSAVSLPKGKGGDLKRLDVDKYVTYLKEIFGGKLRGLRVLLDTANGATCSLAPKVFRELGCKVTVINDEQDGINVNVKCGATDLDAVLKREKEGDYDIAFAFDGDGDRVMTLRKGRVLDGDRMLYVISKYLIEKGGLAVPIVVGTVNSNVGLERALEGLGITLERTLVGDKFVAERMINTGARIGGESSGHVILSDYSATGDGILTALFMALIEAERGIDALDGMVAYPTFTDEVYADDVTKKRFANEDMITNYVSALCSSQGVRAVVRASGTEPKIRILVEAETYEKARENSTLIKCFIKDALAQDVAKKEHKTRCLDTQTAIYKAKNIDNLIQNGVTVLDPHTTYVDERATISEGSVIYPMCSVFGNTTIGKNVTLYSFCDLTDCEVGDGASLRSVYAIEAIVGARSTIGPFTCLRKGARIGEGCRVGDFVEIKNSTLGDGVKAAHLAYVGDAEVGEKTNVGCGTVFANYNGKIKRKSKVGKGVFIGCNTNLIAPVTLGDGVYIAGGSTVTGEVEDNKFVISRVAQQVKERRKE